MWDAGGRDRKKETENVGFVHHFSDRFRLTYPCQKAVTDKKDSRLPGT